MHLQIIHVLKITNYYIYILNVKNIMSTLCKTYVPLTYLLSPVCCPQCHVSSVAPVVQRSATQSSTPSYNQYQAQLCRDYSRLPINRFHKMFPLSWMKTHAKSIKHDGVNVYPFNSIPLRYFLPQAKDDQRHEKGVWMSVGGTARQRGLREHYHCPILNCSV